MILASGGSVDDGGLFAGIEAVCAGFGNAQAAEIRQALTQIAARVIEMRLLGDETLREIARYPDVYLGRAEDLVRSRIEELGLAPLVDEGDARYIARLLVSGAPRTTAPEPVADALVSALFRRIRADGRLELRCAVCGFHFRRGDLSSSRAEMADQFDFEFAADLLPGRRRDSMKPPERTMLHVDHVVPRLGFGPTRSDNLQVLCEFCNTGKLVYRRSLEGVSTYIAASAPPIDGMPPAFLRRQSVVSALMRYRACATCGAGPEERELSVRSSVAWFTPWTLVVRCYACLEND